MSEKFIREIKVTKSGTDHIVKSAHESVSFVDDQTTSFDDVAKLQARDNMGLGDVVTYDVTTGTDPNTIPVLDADGKLSPNVLQGVVINKIISITDPDINTTELLVDDLLTRGLVSGDIIIVNNGVSAIQGNYIVNNASFGVYEDLTKLFIAEGTSVRINDSLKPSLDGVVDLDTVLTNLDVNNALVNIDTTTGATTVTINSASTSTKGIVQLYAGLDGTDGTMAASALATKALKDLVDAKQGTLTAAEPITITGSEISIQDATTTAKGVVQLSSALDSDSETTAATSKATKDLKDSLDTLEGTVAGLGTDKQNVLTAASPVNIVNDVISITTGTAAGNVPVLDANGKLANSTIPALAINNIFSTDDNTLDTKAKVVVWANTQTPTPEQGDIIVVANDTDVRGTYIISSATLVSETDLTTLATPSEDVTIEIDSASYTSVNGIITFPSASTTVKGVVQLSTAIEDGNTGVVTSGQLFDEKTALDVKITANTTLIGTKADTTVVEALDTRVDTIEAKIPTGDIATEDFVTTELAGTVKYDEAQTLTDPEKTQALGNIGAQAKLTDALNAGTNIDITAEGVINSTTPLATDTTVGGFKYSIDEATGIATINLI